MNIKEILLILLVVLIFGTNFVAMKFGLEEMPPLLFVALRFTLVVIPLIFLVPPPKIHWTKIFAVGFFINTGQFALLFIAMQADISAGLASLLLQCQVPLTLMLSYLILAEKITAIQFSGIALALVGFIIFVVQAGGNVTLLGIVLVFAAALSWALGNLVLKTAKQSNALHLVVWASLVPPIPMYTLSYFIESQSPLIIITSLSWLAWLSVGYVAFLSTIVGYTIWSSLMAKHSAIQVTPFALLIPIIGMISASIVLDERLSSSEQLGTVIVLLGLMLCVFGGRWQRLFNRNLRT